MKKSLVIPFARDGRTAGPSIRRASLALVGGMLAASALMPASAVTFIGSAGLLQVKDTLDWATIGIEFDLFAQPLNATTAGLDGVVKGVQVTKASPGDFERVTEGSGWLGNFNPGDELLWTYFEPGPVSIELDTPVKGIGLYIQPDDFVPFTASIEAFDAVGNSLGSFSFNGDSTDQEDGSARFLGVVDDNAVIGKIAVDVSTGGPLAISGLSLGQKIVPEGNTVFAAFALVGCGLATWLIRRRAQA